MRDPKRQVSLRLPTALMAAFAALLLAVAGFAAVAQDAGTELQPDTVVATVGDATITEADVGFIAEDLQQELQQIPAGDRKAFLVARLIERKIMAQAARALELEQTDIFRQRLLYLEDRALQRAFFIEEIAARITPEAVQAAYDEFVAGFQPQEEVRASHILVATEDDAEAVKAELETGKPFEIVAMEVSIDPSAAQNGGDLGFFQRGQMVRPFEDVVFSLEPGQISDPVETQFGWHIIRVEETRQSAPPPLAQVEGQLQQQVLFQAFDETVSELRQDVEISILDTAIAAGVDRELSVDGEDAGDASAQ